jgi:hypothetical protein
MRKTEVELKAARKKRKKQEKHKHRGMIKITAQYSCGCCYADMYFKSLESAGIAFSKVGLTSAANITDDEGTLYEGIDTFYDFSTDPAEMESPPLERLAKKAGLI